MNKQQAVEKIAEMVSLNESNLALAAQLADQFDIEFHFDTPDGTNITYVPQNGKRPTIDQYYNEEYDVDAQEESGDYNFAGWQNSSTFC